MSVHAPDSARLTEVIGENVLPASLILGGVLIWVALLFLSATG